MTAPLFRRPASRVRRVERATPAWSDLKSTAIDLISNPLQKKQIFPLHSSWEQLAQEKVFPEKFMKKLRQLPKPLKQATTVEDLSAALGSLSQRIDFLEGRLAELECSDLEITEPDDSFSWCVNNVAQLKAYRGGMVAIKLPKGIVAAGRTLEEFEAQMKALDGPEVNDLYVTSVDAFL